MRIAWKALGAPSLNTKSVLVAGTNGKGTTSGILWHLLSSMGIKAGYFSSPHLIEFRERILVSGVNVSNALLVKHLRHIKSVLDPDLWEELTFFEINTLLAFSVFEESRTHINVLEVGLGGRWDCTNVVSPMLTMITSIGLDHQEYLGSTTAAVASEKVGIMRKGVDCLWGGIRSADEASDLVVRETSDSVGAGLKVLGEHFGIQPSQDGEELFVGSKHYEIPSRVRHWPLYLRQNFSMACAGFQVLAKELALRLEANQDLLSLALERFGQPEVPWPPTLLGRFQRIQVGKANVRVNLLLDVCHNPHGAAAFSRGLEETGLATSSKKRPAFISILKDKDAGGIWEALKGKISKAYLFRIDSDRTWTQSQIPLSEPMFGSFLEAFHAALGQDNLNQDFEHPWLVFGSVAAVGIVLQSLRIDGWDILDQL